MWMAPLDGQVFGLNRPRSEVAPGPAQVACECVTQRLKADPGRDPDTFTFDLVLDV